MRKLILSMIFVLGTGMMLNANTLDEQKKGCAQIAFELQTDLEESGVPMEQASETASLVYDICVIFGGNGGGGLQ